MTTNVFNKFLLWKYDRGGSAPGSKFLIISNECGYFHKLTKASGVIIQSDCASWKSGHEIGQSPPECRGTGFVCKNKKIHKLFVSRVTSKGQNSGFTLKNGFSGHTWWQLPTCYYTRVASKKSQTKTQQVISVMVCLTQTELFIASILSLWGILFSRNCSITSMESMVPGLFLFHRLNPTCKMWSQY